MSIIIGSRGVRSGNSLAQICQALAWIIAIVACVLALVAWGTSYNWPLSSLSVYTVFPLLGLLAFSLMWSHYIAGFVRQLLKLPKAILATYFESTSLIVLVLICLHPGLLIYQRFHDGYGLPPGSYESYVRPGLGWVTLLGSASLLVFLAYEFRRKFGERPWWQYMDIAVDVAMLAIFYHGLRLGSQLQQGWFRYIWWFYGLSLVIVLAYKYINKYTSRHAD